MCESLGVAEVQLWFDLDEELTCYTCGACSFTVIETLYDTFLVDPDGEFSPYRVEIECEECGECVRVNLKWKAVAEIDSSLGFIGLV